MYAYCNNNPACCSDPTGELTDGQIHDSVLAAIILDYRSREYYYLSMTDTMIYYNGKDRWSGWGYCDLYDLQTGEVWELKKDSKSYSCTTQAAKRQLGRYVNGRLASNPNLPLSRGGDLVFEKTTYTIGDSNGTYTITYWQNVREFFAILIHSRKITQKAKKPFKTQDLRVLLQQLRLWWQDFAWLEGQQEPSLQFPS